MRKYYFLGGQTILLDEEGELQYIITDHLGSVVSIADEGGTLTSQQRYLPFGGVRTLETPSYSPISETDYGYTSQRDLASTGMIDYKARFYNPYITHFAQPDTIVPDLLNPQAWNRYSYALNNPIRYNDPTGHCPTCLAGAALGAIAGALIYTGTTWSARRAWSNDDYLAAVAVGALGGTLIGLGFSAPAGVGTYTAIGSGAGAIGGQIGYSLVAGKDYESEEMLISAGVGTIAGAISGFVAGGAGLAVAGATRGVVASVTGKVIVSNAIINGSASWLQYELTTKYNHKTPTLQGRGAAFTSGAASSLVLDGIFPASVVSASISRMAVSTYSHFNMYVNGSPSGLKNLLAKEVSSQTVRGASADWISRKLELLIGE